MFERNSTSEAETSDVLDELADSRVSIVGEGNGKMIKKLYTGALRTIKEDGFNAEVLKRFLEVYQEDCQHIHRLETEKPEMFSFVLVSGARVTFHIVPQGDSIERVDDTYAVIGQEFIDGNNLRDDLDQENVSLFLYQAEPEIRNLLLELSDRINSVFPARSRSYRITEPNVKIKDQNGEIHAYITDLADSLVRSIAPEVIWPK